MGSFRLVNPLDHPLTIDEALDVWAQQSARAHAHPCCSPSPLKSYKWDQLWRSACMQPCASLLRTVPAFNCVAPSPAKICIAAYAAGLAAHLLLRASTLLPSLSCRTLCLASRINAPVGGHHHCLSERRCLEKESFFSTIAPTLPIAILFSYPCHRRPIL